MDVWHKPVMAQQVKELLRVQPGGLYCDGTLGGGGHARVILEASAPDGRLVGLDRDPAALARNQQLLPSSFGDRITLAHGNFADVVEILSDLGMVPVDGLLLDLGVSSHQLDTADRGFSFRHEGPLDMRMDTTGGQSARDFIEQSTESELAWVIQSYGEQRASRRVARAIKQALDRGELNSTADLARVVSGAVPGSRKPRRIHPATRTFQALRMAVNDELGSLERFLETFDQVLRPGGRVAIIAFHSLEDRAVKRRFAKLANPCTCPPGLPVCACGLEPTVSLLTRKPRRPLDDEVAENPRSRSARLRAVEVL